MDEKRPRIAPGPLLSLGVGCLEVHAAHAAYAAAAATHLGSEFATGCFGHHGFGGHEQACDRGCVLKCCTDNLCGDRLVFSAIVTSIPA